MSPKVFQVERLLQRAKTGAHRILCKLQYLQITTSHPSSQPRQEESIRNENFQFHESSIYFKVPGAKVIDWAMANPNCPRLSIELTLEWSIGCNYDSLIDLNVSSLDVDRHNLAIVTHFDLLPNA